MAELYASIESDRRKKEVGACGNKQMSVHVRGWDDGIKVDVLRRDDGQVEWAVHFTGGSKNASNQKYIASGSWGKEPG